MRAALLMLLFLASPALVQAAGPHRSPPQAFSVHDLDRDGFLSREEYAALRDRCRERLDARGRPRCALKDFDALDANRDGGISEEELLETLGRRSRGPVRE